MFFQVCRSLESVLVTRELGLQMRFDSLLPSIIMGDRHRIRQVCVGCAYMPCVFMPPVDDVRLLLELITMSLKMTQNSCNK